LPAPEQVPAHWPDHDVQPSLPPEEFLMKVAVTGGSGKLGRNVVRRLSDDGHEVTNLDRTGVRGRGFTEVDLRNYGQVVDVFLGLEDRHAGFDAVVHLAAIPAPGHAPDAATFENNMQSTYNVFQAARRAGIKKIVYASSETVLGLPFDVDPPYIPVDEDYPARPESTYSLVKHLEEQMAIQLTRWDPALSITGLRFSNVMDPEDYEEFPSFDRDARARKWNLWGYIDGRDGAQAVARALEHGKPGFEAFIIANEDTVMSRSSASLAAEVFPNVKVVKDLAEHETMLSIDKAKRLLGYAPEHTWRNYHPLRTTPTED
jgi:nucleoside-diphosphate-sugar epimerase